MNIGSYAGHIPNLLKLDGISAGSESSNTLNSNISFFDKLILLSNFMSNGNAESIVKSFSAQSTLSFKVKVYKVESRLTFDWLSNV